MSSFCPGCGNTLAENDTFCASCGRSASATAATPPMDPAAAFGLLPETSGKAIFSMVCGVLGFFPPAAMVAVIFGHLSLSEIRRSGGKLAGRGLAITGLVLGYAGTVFLVGLIVYFAASVPRLMRAQQEAQAVRSSRTYSKTYATPGDRGASAVSVVRAMNTAEIAYSQAHPGTGYTCSVSALSALGTSTEVANARKNGYIVALQGCAAKISGGPITKYQLVAYPAATNQAGRPALCSSESDEIKISRNGSIQDCLMSGVELSASEINHPKEW